MKRRHLSTSHVNPPDTRLTYVLESGRVRSHPETDNDFYIHAVGPTGKRVGRIGIFETREDDPAYREDRPLYGVSTLSVNDTHKKQGIGIRLYIEAVREVDKRGARLMSVPADRSEEADGLHRALPKYLRHETIEYGGEDVDVYSSKELAVARKNPPSAEAIYIATLLNPVDKKPYAITWNVRAQRVYVVTPKADPGTGDIMGEGYFEDDGHEAKSTGCPRSNTPGGVKKKGVGLGLMLYSGLALTAAYSYNASEQHRRAKGLPKTVGTCISSSPDNRSRLATAWWEAQVARGFAEEKEVEGGDEEECEDDDFDVEMDADSVIDQDSMERKVQRKHGGDARLKDYSVGSVTVSYEYCTGDEDGGETTVQVLEAESVASSRIVLDANDKIDDLFDWNKDAAPLDIFKEMDLSDVSDLGFIQMIEDQFVVVAEIQGRDEEAGTFQKFLRTKIPFWLGSKGEVEHRKAGAFRGYSRNKGEPEYSKLWEQTYGEAIAAEEASGL